LILVVNGFLKNCAAIDYKEPPNQLTDGHSHPLQPQITVEDKAIAFHRLDNGEKLLPPAELDLALAQEIQRSKELGAQLAMYQKRFGELPPEIIVTQP
jgi:hypothetical protein